MKVITGKVVTGRIVIDGEPLGEGSTVTVLAPEHDETFVLDSQADTTLLDAWPRPTVMRWLPASNFGSSWVARPNSFDRVPSRAENTPGAMPTALRRHVLPLEWSMSTRRRHGTQRQVSLDCRFCSSEPVRRVKPE